MVNRSPFSPIPERRGRRPEQDVVDVRSPAEDSTRRSERLELPPAASVASQSQGPKETAELKNLEDATDVEAEAEVLTEGAKKKLLEDKLKNAKRDLEDQKARDERATEKEPSESSEKLSHISSQVMTDQDPCKEGLWCKLYGQQGCKKWISNRWAYKQHLQTKHKLGKGQATKLADDQWDQLEKELGPVPAHESGQAGRKKKKKEDDEEPLRDTRRPAEPRFPPKLHLKPREAVQEAEMKPERGRQPKVRKSEPSEPSQPASSSNDNAGMQLLREVAGCRRPCPAVDPRAMKDRFSSGSAPGGLQNSGYNITQNPSSLHKSPDPQLQTLCRSRQSKAQHRLWEGEKREGSEGFGI